MIIIKTAQGNRFVNENSVRDVKHIKDDAIVRIVYNGGTIDTIYQVESVCYTNKHDIEVKDNGLALEETARSLEFYEQEAQWTKNYAKQMYDRCQTLERVIIEYEKSLDREYIVLHARRIKDERDQRQGDFELDLRAFQDAHMLYPERHKKVHEYGKNVADTFAKLTARIAELSKQIEGFTVTIEPSDIHRRGLFERIFKNGYK